MGGGLGYIYTTGVYNVTVRYTAYTHAGTQIRTESEERIFSQHYCTFGLNVGYKFLTSPGVYFRTGIYLGGAVYGDSNYDKYDNDVVVSHGAGGDRGAVNWLFIYKPDLTVGYYFK